MSGDGIFYSMTEYVTHLDEHFVDPISAKDGHYVTPTKPGYSIQMKSESLADFEFPHGSEWNEK